jgi:hypothetical protein
MDDFTNKVIVINRDFYFNQCSECRGKLQPHTMETSSIPRRTAVTFGPTILIFFDPTQPSAERYPMNIPSLDRWSNTGTITAPCTTSSPFDCQPRQPLRR